MSNKLVAYLVDREGRRMLHGPQCAIRRGIRYTTWCSYLSRGQAPERDGIDEEGRDVWYPATIDAWRVTDRKAG